MPKAKKKARKVTTSEALELLLGRKAAKRLRQLAMRLVAEASNQKNDKKGKKRKKARRRNKRR